jgi:hypothetical protein
MPDDGNQYELIEGLLVVSPSPTWQHQRVVGRLFRILADACPVDLPALREPIAGSSGRATRAPERRRTGSSIRSSCR